jgi:autotransporter-associated beta strand protein
MSRHPASRCFLVVLTILSIFASLSAALAIGPNDRLYQECFGASSDDSPFRSDWQILNNNIFFGGAQGLFGLSPAGLLRRQPMPSFVESSAEGTMAAETSAPNEKFLSFFSAESAFVFARGSAPDPTEPSGPISLVPAAPLADSPAISWDGGPTGGGNLWYKFENWVFDLPPGSGQRAQFGSAGTVTLISIDMTNMITATNHGLANQIVGDIELLSGTRTFVAVGTGTLTLAGATANGVSNVILRNASAGQLTIQSGGTSPILDVALGEFSSDNVIVIDGSGNITISGVIKTPGPAPGHITLTGAGTGALVLTGNNTYTGGTTISAGTLQINSATSLGNQSATAVIGNGTLQATANITTTRNFQLSDANSRISVDSGRTFTISGTLSDGATAGTLNKNGTGTLSLTGTANTFTGGVNVNAGTLTAAVGSLVNIGGSITVNSGGTLMLSSNGRHLGANTPVVLNGGTFATGGFSEPNGGPSGLATSAIGALTLTATSTIDFGSGNTSILEFAGLGTHTAGALLQITNWDGTPITGGSGDRLLFAGLTTSFAAAYLPTDVSFNGVFGYNLVQFDIGSDPYYEVVPILVPEPATWVGAALALGAVAFASRKRNPKCQAPKSQVIFKS